MKRSQRSSQRPENSTRRTVRNQLMVGDSKLSFMVKPEQRSLGPQHGFNTIQSSPEADLHNFYISQFPDEIRRVKLADGSSFAREIGAKKPRAADVYGSMQNALEASYRRDRTTKERIEGTEYVAPKKKRTKRGGLKTTSKPRNRGLI